MSEDIRFSVDHPNRPDLLMLRVEQVIRERGHYVYAFEGLRAECARRSHGVWTWRVWRVIGNAPIAKGVIDSLGESRRRAVKAMLTAAIEDGKTQEASA